MNDSMTVKRGIAKVVGLRRPEGRHTATHTYLLAPPEGSGAVTPNVPPSEPGTWVSQRHCQHQHCDLPFHIPSFAGTAWPQPPPEAGDIRTRHGISTYSTDVCV